MERRLSIYEGQHEQLYKNKRKENDYFIAICSNNQLILFDTLKEAEQFNENIKETFKTKLDLNIEPKNTNSMIII